VQLTLSRRDFFSNVFMSLFNDCVSDSVMTVQWAGQLRNGVDFLQGPIPLFSSSSTPT